MDVPCECSAERLDAVGDGTGPSVATERVNHSPVSESDSVGPGRTQNSPETVEIESKEGTVHGGLPGVQHTAEGAHHGPSEPGIRTGPSASANEGTRGRNGVARAQ